MSIQHNHPKYYKGRISIFGGQTNHHKKTELIKLFNNQKQSAFHNSFQQLFYPTSLRKLVSHPPYQTKMTETKQVRFSDTAQIESVREVPNLGQLTPEEKQAIWFSSCDYEQIKDEDDIIVRSMTLGTVSNEMCTRGLENRLTKSSDPRKLVGLDVICAVLDEQDRQRSSRTKSVSDLERLRSASMNFSRVSQEEALKQGYQDAIAAGNKSYQAVFVVPEKNIDSKSLDPNVNKAVSKAALQVPSEPPKKIMSVAARRFQRFMDRTKSNRRGI